MKIKSLLLAGLAALLCMAVMTACSNSVDESDETILLIDFGGFEKDERVKSESIVYEIDIIDALDGTVNTVVRNKGDKIGVKLNSGNYNIEVIAYKDSINIGNEFAKGYSKEIIEVIAGVRNSVIIDLNLIDALQNVEFTPTIPGNSFTYKAGEVGYFHSDALHITLTSPDGGTIRYTTDGSEPTSSSQIYTAPIPIKTLGATVLKAKAFSSVSHLGDSVVTAVTYTLNTPLEVVTANGSISPLTSTTALTFTFTLPVKDLTVNNIAITNGTGAFTKGTLTPSNGDPVNGYKTWTLSGTPAKDGSIQVNIINKAGIVSGNKTISRIYRVFPLWTAIPAGTGSGTSTFGTSVINAVACGNMFVAVGDGGKIASSPDGITWTAVANSPFSSSESIYSIACGWGSNRFFAGGANGKMAYSDNVINWYAVTNSPFVTSRVYYIVASYRLLAVGGNKIASTDNSSGNYGANWIIGYSTSTFGTDDVYRVAVSDAYIVITSYVGGKMAYSNDYINFTTVVNNTFGSTRINGITNGSTSGNRFVAVGDSGKIAYANDVTNWTAIANSTFGASNIIAVAWGANMFVVVGDSGKMAYSPDGITWTAVADSAFGVSGIRAIAWGGGKFVAVGNNGKIAYARTQ